MRARQVKVTLTGTQADALWAAGWLALDETSRRSRYNRQLQEAVELLKDAIDASQRRRVTVKADEKYL